MNLRRLFPLLLLLLACAMPAYAHVGSKDVFEQVVSGPYSFFITIRPPNVVPGVAVVEVRVAGPQVDALTVAPVPLTGEASHHPPTPDSMHRSADDPAFFTGSVWLMAAGSWQVRLQATGPAGAATASVPVAAMALNIMRMQRPLGALLAVLGVTLILGMAGIIYGAVQEARLPPGTRPSAERRRRAAFAGAAALVLLVIAAWAGDRWWNVEAAGYSADIYTPLTLRPTLVGSTLDLRIDPGRPDEQGRHRNNDDLLPDHGHLMHLYAIRWPQMDAVYHLHPALAGPGELRSVLPSMPPGTYHLFGDIVHRSGFPETLTAILKVPADASHNFLDSEDAAAYPAPLSDGDLGTRYKLPDGYTMVWDRPANLTANTPEIFRFRLLDPAGKPASGMRPYLGMAGHAAFVKTDGTVFAHTHPEGSAAMPAMMLANQSPSNTMPGMSMDSGMSDPALQTTATGNNPAGTGKHTASVAPPLRPEVSFPYGFPSPGRYRIFIQMRHNDTVETGVFDAEVS